MPSRICWRCVEALVQRFGLLTEHLRLGRLRPEFGPDVRSLAVESHVVYYRVEDEVLIARVLHGRRDQIAAWQERLPEDESER